MGHRWGEHVGELELRLDGGSEAEVFAAATAALAELLADDGPPDGAPAERRVRAEGGDRALLLAAFLDELVFLAETDGFVPAALTELALGAGAVDARIAGRLGRPPHLVKAVTHHRLAFDRTPGGWRATAVLDV